MGYYIEEGRRVKFDLNKYQTLNFNEIANTIAVNPDLCLHQSFSLHKFGQENQSFSDSSRIESNHFENKSFVGERSRFSIGQSDKENIKLLEPVIEKHKSTPE